MTDDTFRGAVDWLYVLKVLFYYYGTVLTFMFLSAKLEERILASVVIHKKEYFWPWCEVDYRAKNVSRFWKNVDCERCLRKRNK